MGQFQLHVYLTPVAGREDDFHEWYENTHIDDVLRTAGYASGQRFALEATAGKPMPNTHLAVYETQAESAQEVIDRLNSTREQRDMSGADVLDIANVALWVLSPLGEKHLTTRFLVCTP